jgi:hypothetical protein
MSEQIARNPRVPCILSPDGVIDCPDCGRTTAARLVIWVSASGVTIVACLECRHLFPAENVGLRSELPA